MSYFLLLCQILNVCVSARLSSPWLIVDFFVLYLYIHGRILWVELVAVLFFCVGNEIQFKIASCCYLVDHLITVFDNLKPRQITALLLSILEDDDTCISKNINEVD